MLTIAQIVGINSEKGKLLLFYYFIITIIFFNNNTRITPLWLEIGGKIILKEKI